MAGDKVLRHLAMANMLEGCIVVLFQLAVLITLHDWVDWICIGFWGGGLMVMAGMWALQRSQKKMITTAALAMFGGLCLVGFYSWHVSTVDCSQIDRRQNESSKSQWEDDYVLCDWRLASDILFIIFGLLAIGINMSMAVRGSTLTGAARSRRSSDSSRSGQLHHRPAPVAHPAPVAIHHHTTYVTPEATYPIPYNAHQQHQVMPAGYPAAQQPVHYPVYAAQHQNPNQPAYNPGYPAPGAPPYYKE